MKRYPKYVSRAGHEESVDVGALTRGQTETIETANYFSALNPILTEGLTEAYLDAYIQAFDQLDKQGVPIAEQPSKAVEMLRTKFGADAVNAKNVDPELAFAWNALRDAWQEWLQNIPITGAEDDAIDFRRRAIEIAARLRERFPEIAKDLPPTPSLEKHGGIGDLLPDLPYKKIAIGTGVLLVIGIAYRLLK